MARCSFCGRSFKSAQSVRAHLRFCPAYQRMRPNPSAPPPARRATTEEEDLRRLWGPAAPSNRSHPAPQTIEPPRVARRPAPPRDPDWSREMILQECRRQWEALQEEERRHAAEQRSRAAQERSLIQEVKCLVVDLDFTREPMPPEALAEAKEQIERTLTTLPILELPPVEVQQIAAGVRERVFAQFRRPPAPVALPSHRDVTQTTGHAQLTEVPMPMHRVLTGYFMCPRCDEEFELDLVPEKEAVCADCRVPLEELEMDEDDDDDQ